MNTKASTQTETKKTYALVQTVALDPLKEREAMLRVEKLKVLGDHICFYDSGVMHVASKLPDQGTGGS